MEDQQSTTNESSYSSNVFLWSSFFMFVLVVMMALESGYWELTIIFLFIKIIEFVVLFAQKSQRFLRTGYHAVILSYFLFVCLALHVGSSVGAVAFNFVLIILAFLELSKKPALLWSLLSGAAVLGYTLFTKNADGEISTETFYTVGIVSAASLVHISTMYQESSQISRLKGSSHGSESKSPAQNSIGTGEQEIILNSIDDGVVKVDGKGVITSVNKAALQLLEARSIDLINVPVGGAIPLKLAGTIVEQNQYPVYQVITTQRGLKFDQFSRAKYELSVASGKTIRVGLNINPIMSDGQISGAVMLLRDLTEIERMDRAKSEFVSLASHQLRTPLNVVSWYIEKLIAQKKGPLNEKQQEYTKQVYENNKRMIVLVGDLLNASRVDIGKLNLKKETVDLIRLANQLVAEIKIAMDQKNITFNASLPRREIVFRDGDISVTTVIIQNLLSNAMKYTNEGGQIDFSISLQPTGTTLNEQKPFKTTAEGVLINVTDTGVGIPIQQQKKIFGKLFRADNVSDLDVEGTGLGLYVTKSFAEALGGEIWFESEEGKGTSFSVYFPFPTPLIRKSPVPARLGAADSSLGKTS